MQDMALLLIQIKSLMGLLSEYLILPDSASIWAVMRTYHSRQIRHAD